MQKMALTVAVLTPMLLLGAADAFFIEGLPSFSGEPEQVAEVNEEGEPMVTTEAPDDGIAPELPVSPGGVRKRRGPDILAVLAARGFSLDVAHEPIILSRVVPEGEATLESRTLLLDGDHAGAIAWVESPNVKTYFLVLKEAVHAAFTAGLQDLLDETQIREGHPTRNLLTFIDTGLVPERVVFIRVQERLFEFHLAENREQEIYEIIEELTE